MLRGYTPDGQGTGGYSVSGGVALSTLVTGLVAYWSLDETSGTRVDSAGSADLSDNNTVGYDTGKSSNAASFVATNTEYLSNTGFPLPDDVTVSAWLYMTNVAVANVGVISADHAVGLWWQNQGLLIFVNDSKLYLRISEADGGYPTTDGHALTADAWHHVVATFKTATGAGNLYLDNGTADALALDSARLGGPFNFFLGIGVGLNLADMLLDEVGIWSRVLTEDERAELYNSGTGKFYNGTNFV